MASELSLQAPEHQWHDDEPEFDLDTDHKADFQPDLHAHAAEDSAIVLASVVKAAGVSVAATHPLHQTGAVDMSSEMVPAGLRQLIQDGMRDGFREVAESQRERDSRFLDRLAAAERETQGVSATMDRHVMELKNEIGMMRGDVSRLLSAVEGPGERRMDTRLAIHESRLDSLERKFQWMAGVATAVITGLILAVANLFWSKITK